MWPFNYFLIIFYYINVVLEWKLIYIYIYIQGEHKFFPWLQTFIKRKLRGIETYLFFFSKCNSTQEVFFTTHQYTSTCAPFVARRTSNRQSISLHVFSSMSSVIVAKSSVILAFQICNIWNWCPKHFVFNVPPITRSQGGVISGDRGGQGVGPSLPIYLFGNVASKNRRTSEPQCGGAPSCWKIIHDWNSCNWVATKSSNISRYFSCNKYL